MNETPGPEGYEAGGEAMSREGSVDTSVAGGESVQGSPLVDSGAFSTPLEPRTNGDAVQADKPPSLGERKSWNMFINSTIYAFIRFFQVSFRNC